jgi:hypothetical protein
MPSAIHVAHWASLVAGSRGNDKKFFIQQRSHAPAFTPFKLKEDGKIKCSMVAKK